MYLCGIFKSNFLTIILLASFSTSLGFDKANDYPIFISEESQTHRNIRDWRKMSHMNSYALERNLRDRNISSLSKDGGSRTWGATEPCKATEAHEIQKIQNDHPLELVSDFSTDEKNGAALL